MKWATLPQACKKYVYNFIVLYAQLPKNMMIMIIIMTIMAFVVIIWCIVTPFLFQVNPLGTFMRFWSVCVNVPIIMYWSKRPNLFFSICYTIFTNDWFDQTQKNMSCYEICMLWKIIISFSRPMCPLTYISTLLLYVSVNFTY